MKNKLNIFLSILLLVSCTAVVLGLNSGDGQKQLIIDKSLQELSEDASRTAQHLERLIENSRYPAAKLVLKSKFLCALDSVEMVFGENTDPNKVGRLNAAIRKLTAKLLDSLSDSSDQYAKQLQVLTQNNSSGSWAIYKLCLLRKLYLENQIEKKRIGRFGDFKLGLYSKINVRDTGTFISVFPMEYGEMTNSKVSLNQKPIRTENGAKSSIPIDSIGSFNWSIDITYRNEKIGELKRERKSIKFEVR